MAPTPGAPWIPPATITFRATTSPAWRRRPPAIRWASWSLHPAAIRPTSPARRPATPRARSAFYRNAAPPAAWPIAVSNRTLDAVESNVIYLAQDRLGSSIPLEFGLQLTRIMAEQRVRWALYLGSADDTRGLHRRSSSTATGIFFAASARSSATWRSRSCPRSRSSSPVPRKTRNRGRSGRGGIRFVAGVADAIAASPRYQATTLVLVTHLTSGASSIRGAAARRRRWRWIHARANR